MPILFILRGNTRLLHRKILNVPYSDSKKRILCTSHPQYFHLKDNFVTDQCSYETEFIFHYL